MILRAFSNVWKCYLHKLCFNKFFKSLQNHLNDSNNYLMSLFQKLFFCYVIHYKKHYQSTFLFSISKSQLIIFLNIFNESAINGNVSNIYWNSHTALCVDIIIFYTWWIGLNNFWRFLSFDMIPNMYNSIFLMING